MGRITIKDIARVLDIHPATVSRALNGQKGVNETMRQKVHSVAKDLGYSPNKLAINFRRRHSYTIGLLLPEMNNFSYPSSIRAIEEICRMNDHHLVMLQAANDVDNEARNLDICAEVSVDGILASVVSESLSKPAFEKFLERDIPVVLFDKTVPGLNTAKTTIDDVKVGFDAVRILCEKGYTNLYGLFGSRDISITRQRIEGFMLGLQEFGLGSNDYSILTARNSLEARERIATLPLSLAERSALFCMSDELLVGAMPALAERGIKIPDQLALLSISNGLAPHYYHPAVSHLHHSGYEVGETAARLLFDRIRNNSEATKHIEVLVHMCDEGTTPDLK